MKNYQTLMELKKNLLSGEIDISNNTLLGSLIEILSSLGINKTRLVNGLRIHHKAKFIGEFGTVKYDDRMTEDDILHNKKYILKEIEPPVHF